MGNPSLLPCPPGKTWLSEKCAPLLILHQTLKEKQGSTGYDHFAYERTDST
jgi:hypothetical protein